MDINTQTSSVEVMYMYIRVIADICTQVNFYVRLMAQKDTSYDSSIELLVSYQGRIRFWLSN